jgi:hypothetical protein
MAKGVFQRKGVRQIGYAVGAGLILWIIERSVPGFNPFGMLAKVLVKMHHFKIPGSIFLVTVAAVVILLIIVMKRHRPVDADLGTKRDEEVKLEELNLNKEHILILGLLGIVKGDMQDESSFKHYMAHNPEKSRLHFKFIIDDLKQKELIEVCLNVIGDNSYLLLAKGLTVLRKLVDMKKEEVQGTG